MRTMVGSKDERRAMADLDKQSKRFGPKRVSGYIKENPHMAVSVGLFCGGGVALWQNVTPLVA